MVLHLNNIKMENKTYLEQRKELEDTINSLYIKVRRQGSNSLSISKEINNLKEELAKLDEAEIKRCKEDAYYFVSTYMTIDDKPVIPILDKETFNREIKGINNITNINRWFTICKGRRNGRG